MAILLPNGKQAFTGVLGLPLVGGKLYTYAAGTNTPQATWTNSAQTVPNANPIILDARGEAVIFWSGAYKITLRDALDNIIWTVDNVSAIDVAGVTGASQVGTADGSNVQAFINSLPASAGSSIIGFIASGVGAVFRTLQAKGRDTISAKDFGAIADGVTDDLAALNKARDAAIAQRKTLVLTDGTYKVSGPWNAITGSNQHIIAQGDVTILCTGAGAGVQLGIIGGALQAIYGCTFGGSTPIRVSGGATTTDAVFSRGVCGSHINVVARNCTNAAFRGIWNVRNYVRVRCIPNGDPAFTTIPSYGLLLEQEGTGYYCAANEFHVWISGLTAGTGIFANANGASFNNFYGASETNNKGIVFAAGCNRNSLIGFDLETNTANDLQDDGYLNSYVGVRSSSPTTGNTIDMGGQGASFHGCSLRQVTLSSVSRATAFFGCGFDNGPTVGIQGSGPYKRVGCFTFDNNFAFVAALDDVVGSSANFTPVVMQGGAVAATSDATYSRVGKLVTIMGMCNITGAGTVNAITVDGVPAAIALPNIGARVVVGNFFALDTGTASYTGVAMRESDSSFSLRKDDGSSLGFTLAAGDTLAFTLSYKVA